MWVADVVKEATQRPRLEDRRLEGSLTGRTRESAGLHFEDRMRTDEGVRKMSERSQAQGDGGWMWE